MPKRSSTNKGRTSDDNKLAKRLEEAASEEEPLPENLRRLIAATLGRRGGLKGGKARAEKLSAERRKEIASIAAKSRWSKVQDE